MGDVVDAILRGRPAEARQPLEPKWLDDKWLKDRLQQTAVLLSWLRDRGAMPNGIAYLLEDTYAKACELLVEAGAACIIGRELADRTIDPTGSPACWAILLAQQAHATVHGWEMDEAGACKQPVSLRCSVCAALMFARLIASRSASLERASDA